MLEFNNRELSAILRAFQSYTPAWGTPHDPAMYSAERKVRNQLYEKLSAASKALPPKKRGEGVAIRSELRNAAVEKRKVSIKYVDAAGEISERVIHPLGFNDSAQKTVRAWCELRREERSFKTARIAAISVLGSKFTPTDHVMRW
jgi:predicted DNA-binding transcriptional regulator YafY